MAGKRDDYEVGYGKPPREHQFPKGQSGNSKGRKKGGRGLKTDLREQLEARMTIRINNEPVRASRQQLMVMGLVMRAATGDLRAQKILIPLMVQILGVEDRGSDVRALSPADQAILDELLADVASFAPEASPSSDAAAGSALAADRTDDETDIADREVPPLVGNGSDGHED